MRLRQRGLRLILDFVANHVAADHGWTVTNPELLVKGSKEDLLAEPHNFFQVGDGESAGIFAHGRDPYFDGWEDTVQLYHGSPAVQEEMSSQLAQVAGMCDGVRCDMAMLQCPTVFQQTWGRHLAARGEACALEKEQEKLFWPTAIKAAREANKDFLLIAEVYWGREYELQAYGFDYTLDKVAYEQLSEGRADDLRKHLAQDIVSVHRRSARYLETHADKRAAEVFGKRDEQVGTSRLVYTALSY